KEGYSVHILDLRTLYPLDKESIIEAARRTGKVLIIHEDNKEGGVGAEVGTLIAEECLYELDAPINRLCGPDVPAMPYNSAMEKYFMPNPNKVYQAMKNLIEY